MKIVSRMSVCRERIISEINMNQVNGEKHVTGTNLVPLLAKASHLNDVRSWGKCSNKPNPMDHSDNFNSRMIWKLLIPPSRIRMKFRPFWKWEHIDSACPFKQTNVAMHSWSMKVSLWRKSGPACFYYKFFWQEGRAVKCYGNRNMTRDIRVHHLHGVLWFV